MKMTAIARLIPIQMITKRVSFHFARKVRTVPMVKPDDQAEIEEDFVPL